MSDHPSLNDILARQRAEKERLAHQQKLDADAESRRRERLDLFESVRYCLQGFVPPGADPDVEFARRLTALAIRLSERSELGSLLGRVRDVPAGADSTERDARLFVADLLTLGKDGQNQEVAQAVREMSGLPFLFRYRVYDWLSRRLEELYLSSEPAPAPLVIDGCQVLRDATPKELKDIPQPACGRAFPSEYHRRACVLLGADELDRAPLPVLTVNTVDDPLRRNIGDLTDRDDQRLAAVLGIQPTEWAALNEEQRIGRMLAVEMPAEALAHPRAHAAADEGAAPADEGEKVQQDAAEPSSLAAVPPELLSASDLARWLKQPRGRVETFLRRYRRDHPDCFAPVKARRKNEPARLYRTKVVWPALQAQLASWRTLGN